MDFQFWVWLVIIVITLIARARKKKEQPPESIPSRPPVRRQSQPDIPDSSSRPLTFEDLLREIQASKTPKPATVQPKKAYEVVDYDDDLEEEYKEPKRIDYDLNREDKVSEIYEESKRQAFARPSLEETMKLEDTNVTYAKFDEYKQPETRNTVTSAYLNDFKDPKGLKKAFVMSEILKRKF